MLVKFLRVAYCAVRCIFYIDVLLSVSIYIGTGYTRVSQPPGRGINYTGPREVFLEFVILVF